MKSSKDGLYPRCKPCDDAAHAAYKLRDPNRHKVSQHKRYIKHKYNLERSEYIRLCEEQNYTCKICSSPNHYGWRLAVDHDHETGKVRGLLCNTCNRALGLLDHNPELFKNAISYLNEHKTH